MLVGTTDIDKSEALGDMLQRKGIPHEVLNAKQHEREAIIVAQAGRSGAVTVATNMAGRGTDIVLGGSTVGLNISEEEWQADHEKVVELGGLHIIGTERHEARRIDNQLRGRAGRQGDPGSSSFFVGLDDDLMRRFGGERIKSIMDWAGIEDDTAIETRMISRSLESAQVKVEAYHFDIRKHLVEYDDVVNTHRSIIYGERNKLLSGADLKANLRTMVEEEIRDIVEHHLSNGMRENWDADGLLQEMTTIFEPPPDLSDPGTLDQMRPEDIEQRLIDHSRELYDAMEEQTTPEVMRAIERQLMLRAIDTNWVQHLTGMDNLRQGIGLYAYGQRDPLVMYKKEGHELFESLQARIQNDIVHVIYHLRATPTGNGNARKATTKAEAGESIMARVARPRSREPVAAGGRKVGRNEPCPCGSGRKYKRCHGG